MSEHDQSSVNPPVGHGRTVPFTGDLQTIWASAGVVLEKIRAQDFLNKELHQNLAWGYGEAATAFLKDGPPPVGVMGATPALDTLEDCEHTLSALMEVEAGGVMSEKGEVAAKVAADVAAQVAANVNYLVWLSLFLRIAELIRDQLSK